MVRHTGADDEATFETKSDLVDAVADRLQSHGYTAHATSFGVVKVDNPADAEAMYEHVDDVVGDSGTVIDVRMTAATQFQIDPDCKDHL